jgi:hypothetical protein
MQRVAHRVGDLYLSQLGRQAEHGQQLSLGEPVLRAEAAWAPGRWPPRAPPPCARR